eukprot:6370803-Amphidinium_carterae.1
MVAALDEVPQPGKQDSSAIDALQRLLLKISTWRGMGRKRGLCCRFRSKLQGCPSTAHTTELNDSELQHQIHQHPYRRL